MAVAAAAAATTTDLQGKTCQTSGNNFYTGRQKTQQIANRLIEFRTTLAAC